MASAREKSIRHGHPSTLHLWWARRPLAAAGPSSSRSSWTTPRRIRSASRDEQGREKERQRLFGIIEGLVQWENTTNETVLAGRAGPRIRRFVAGSL